MKDALWNSCVWTGEIPAIPWRGLQEAKQVMFQKVPAFLFLPLFSNRLFALPLQFFSDEASIGNFSGCCATLPDFYGLLFRPFFPDRFFHWFRQLPHEEALHEQ